VAHIAESAAPYRTKDYKSVLDKWSHEARIHHGLKVALIALATFKSVDFRHAYAEEYAQAYKLRGEEKNRLVKSHMEAASHGHEFLLASFVPEKKWDDFDKRKSMWRLYLINDDQEHVEPVEVRKVKKQDPVITHFFPYITPWKSIYTVRFPHKSPETNQPIIKDSTMIIKFMMTSVLGTAEMSWKLR